MKAFALLLVAILAISTMPVLAQHEISKSSQKISNSSISEPLDMSSRAEKLVENISAANPKVHELESNITKVKRSLKPKKTGHLSSINSKINKSAIYKIEVTHRGGNNYCADCNRSSLNLSNCQTMAVINESISARNKLSPHSIKVSNSPFVSSNNSDLLSPYPQHISMPNYAYENFKNKSLNESLCGRCIFLSNQADNVSNDNMTKSTITWLEDRTPCFGSIKLKEAWNDNEIGWASSDWAYSMRATKDGGYVIVGFVDTDESSDIRLVKLDASGNYEWDNVIGERCIDVGKDVQQTNDGGYIIAGYNTSHNGTVCNNEICMCVGSNAILIKTDSEGDVQWEKVYGADTDSEFISVNQTSDGGYIATGYKDNNDPGKHADLWLVKTDSNGKMVWNRTYGDAGFEIGSSVQETKDGGYIVAGMTTSYGGYKALLLKTDSSGDAIGMGERNWFKTYDSINCSYGISAIEDKDGNFVLTGDANTGDTTDVGLIKTDCFGNTIFSKRYGGKGNDGGRNVKQTRDGGYIIAGYSESFGKGKSDGWVIKTDSDGSEAWNGTVGDAGIDVFWSVVEVSDGYVLAGTTESTDPAGDFWAVKILSPSNPVILVHGIFSSPDRCWGVMKPRLEAEGYNVFTLNYAPGWQFACGDIKLYAKELADYVTQVKRKTGADKVDIVAHSMGGLISRWYIEKDGGDKNVDKLIMIGTPNHGSEVLNLITAEPFKLLPFLLSLIYRVPLSSKTGVALDQMTPGSPLLGSLGYEGRPNYYIIAGTYVNHWILKIPSWYLGLFETDLKRRFDENPYSITNDGVVRYYSAQLESIVPYHYPVDHLEETNDLGVFDKVSSILGGQTTKLTSASEPANDTQESPKQVLPIIADKINATESKLYNINVDPSQNAQFGLMWLNGSLSFSLITPSGIVISQSTANSMANVTYFEGNNSKVYSITNPEPGIWTANISGVDVHNDGVQFALLTTIQTNLTLDITPQKYQWKPGDSIDIRANLTDGLQPISTASVVACITKPDGLYENISLYDDGLHNDGQISDGIYSNSFTNTSLSGAYSIIVYANGSIDNREFRRQGVTTVWAESLPGLTLSSSDISFSNNTPASGDRISINAAVHNMGEAMADNATISFFDGLPEKERIIGNDTISIEAGKTSVASVSWEAEAGVHDIYVKISPYSEFLEANYSNNIASQRIVVKPICRPTGEWTRTFGKEQMKYVASDDAYSVQQTIDGGYIVAGSTESYAKGGDDRDTTDFWVIKTDYNGIEEWNKTFGDYSWDHAYSVEQTIDGGYIVAGETGSYSSGNYDYANIRVVKLDPYGNEEWTKILGSDCSDIGYTIQQTRDGGYIIAGATTPTCSHHFSPFLVKLGSDGSETWDNIFTNYTVDTGTDDTISAIQTSDGGYILTGENYTIGAYFSNLFLLKTDENGNMTWNRTFGGDDDDKGMSIKQTSDGGYIIAGTTFSYGAGDSDIWLLKTDSNGIEQWNRTFGGADYDWGNSVQQTIDGGYVIVGATTGPIANTDNDYLNGWIVKTDSQGIEQWNKSIGAPGWMEYKSVQQTCDGDYILAGSIATSDFVDSDFLLEKISSSFHPPKVANGNGATRITTRSARLNGEIIGTSGQSSIVRIYWGTNDGETTQASWQHNESLGMLPIDVFYKDISGLTPGTQYYYRCYASNSIGSSWANSTSKFKTNAPPNVPSIPSGPATGIPGKSYSYSTSAIDPDDDQILYTFSWGDGAISSTSCISSGTSASITHSWSGAGAYQVKASAMDGRGASSGWSSPLIVIISANNPPGKPSKPSGPASGAMGASYPYTTLSIDPERDKIKYTYDWGDGSTSVTNLVSSGAKASASHKWAKPGIYQIKVKATDNKDASSDWSDPLTFIINSPPSTPSIPQGSTIGRRNAAYTFSTSAVDPDRDMIQFIFDWSDGATSRTGLISSGGKASSSHIWGRAGTFKVKARAMDNKGAYSGWSYALNMTISSQISTPAENATADNSTKIEAIEPLHPVSPRSPKLV